MTEFNTTSDNLAAREQQYTENRLACDSFIRGLVSANTQMGKYPRALVSFTHAGRTVRNPFWSIKGEDSAVDPVGYYGRDFVGSKFVTLALANLAKLEEYAEDVEVEYTEEEEESDHPVYPKGVTINVYGNDVKVERK